jgi:hypothetical protein
MKRLISIAAVCLLGSCLAHAEPRIFKNNEGKSIKAELISVEDEAAVLQLANGKAAKVPLKSLSTEDQTFIAEWWKENKDKLKQMDVKLIIAKKTERIDRKITRAGGAGGAKNAAGYTESKLTIDELHYTGELKSFTRKDVSDIAITYTIFKRVSTTDKNGSETSVEEIDGEASVNLLEANGEATFETEAVRCEDTSIKGGNQPRQLKRETVLGVIFELSTGGQVFLKQSFPENLVDRVEELQK